MTENEWLEAADPEVMLPWLMESGPSERKIRLFCCACCRRVWGLFSDDRCRDAVEVAERFVDGLATEEELAQACERADEAADEAEDADLPHVKKLALVGTSNASAFSADVHPNPYAASEWAVYALAGSSAVDDKQEEARRHAKFGREVRSQAAILRDIFGHLFRLVTLDGSFLTPSIVSLAQKLYDTNAFERLPLLADALEQAGCTEQDILSHCRGSGTHVRGCWVIDAILGKE